MKNFNILGVHGIIRVSGGGGVHEMPTYRGDCLKRGGLGKFADLRGGGLSKKEGGRRVDTPVHTMKKIHDGETMFDP